MPSGWINTISFEQWGTFYLTTDQNKIWPVANDIRRFQGLWLSNQGPLIAPMYARIITRHEIAAGLENRLFTNMELETDDDGNASADSGLNELGRRLTVTLRNWDEPHPVYNELGVSWDWEYSRVGFGTNVLFGVFNMPNTSQHEFTPFWYDWPFNRGTDPIIRSAQVYSSFQPGQDTDWSPQGFAQNYIKFHSIPFGREVPANPQLSPYPPAPGTAPQRRPRPRRPTRRLAVSKQEA